MDGPRVSKGETDKQLSTLPGETPGRSDSARKAPPPRPAVKVIDRAASDPMIGRTVAGRYRIEARLGEGGMGAVYRVEHTHMRKKLALKVLHREMTSQTEIVARFEREAMASAHIEHPNVAAATDFGQLEDGSFYLVLEYVEGTSLRTFIDRGPIEWKRACRIAIQVLSALKRAHELGIIHRDLKPENVLLVEKDGEKDFVKVLDFGIARVPIGSLTGIKGETGKTLTRAGMVYGTPEYMAPEQALGQGVDGRSDVYGVGVMLFEMLTGRRPYDNKDKVALLGQHVAGAIPSIRDRAPAQDLSLELEALLLQLLAKSPDQRFADAQSAADALQSLVVNGPASSANNPMTGAAQMLPATLPATVTIPAERNDDLGGVPLISQPFLLQAPALPMLPQIIDGPRHTPSPVSLAGGQHSATTTPQPSSPSRLDATPLAPNVGIDEESPFTTGARQRRRFATVVLVLATIGVIGAAAFVATSMRGAAQATSASASGSTNAAAVSAALHPSVLPATADEAAIRAKVQAALGRLLSGEEKAAVGDLEAIAIANPASPEALRGLAIAYSKTKRPLDALGRDKALLAIDAKAASDPAVQAVVTDSLETPSAVEPAFALLEGPMGADGGRILYDLSLDAKAPSSTRARAARALAQPDVRKQAPPAIRAALELKEAPNVCATRRSIIDNYRKDLDARSLPFLKQWLPRTGCGGFFKNADCWPCLHENKLLETVVKEIEDRAKATK
jgi:serine/threonine-protein kinase